MCRIILRLIPTQVRLKESLRAAQIPGAFYRLSSKLFSTRTTPVQISPKA